MKSYLLNYVLGAVVVSAIFATPALAATNQTTQAQGQPVAGHANKSGKKNTPNGWFGSANLSHVTGTVGTVGDSSFTLVEGKSSGGKTVTIDFDSTAQFMNVALPFHSKGAKPSSLPKKNANPKTGKKSGNPFLSPLTSSDIVAGTPLMVMGTQNTDGSIKALLVRTVPVDSGSAKNPASKPQSKSDAKSSKVTKNNAKNPAP